MHALDALLLRKVEATTTHLIATSHNAGRPLTRCSRLHSKRAGAQAERVARSPDRNKSWASMVRGLALHGRAPRGDPVFARWKTVVMSAALVAGTVTAVTAVTATVASAAAASAGSWPPQLPSYESSACGAPVAGAVSCNAIELTSPTQYWRPSAAWKGDRSSRSGGSGSGGSGANAGAAERGLLPRRPPQRLWPCEGSKRHGPG